MIFDISDEALTAARNNVIEQLRKAVEKANSMPQHALLQNKTSLPDRASM
ncbi:MAG: hypothetical protein IPM83_15020 [Ignavibacteria bacterium]|nr:hypothetical protein [Ignavibacteria bacterium]